MRSATWRFARHVYMLQALNMGGEVWSGGRLIGIGLIYLMFGNCARDISRSRLNSGGSVDCDS